MVNWLPVARKYLIRKLREWGRAIRRGLRLIFHWKYSGAFIPLFFATGVAMALASRFAMAYAFFVLFGVWSLGYWLTSDFLRKKDASLRKRETRRNPERHKKELAGYRIWQITIVVAVVLLTAGFMGWTRNIQNDITLALLKQQRDDVYDKLSVQANVILTEDNAQRVEVSIVNNAHSDIAAHTVGCAIYSMWNYRQVGFDRGMALSPMITAEGLLGGGRGETVKCQSPVLFKDTPIVCVDMALTVTFKVVGQEDFWMAKEYRFSYDSKKVQPWTQQSIKSTWDYCDWYYKHF
jgi:hypothetical protein